MAKKPLLQSKRPVIRPMSTRTLQLEPGKTQTITLLGTDLDKITAVQVISNNRSINNVKATLGPSSGTSRSVTLTTSPNAEPGNIQIKILAGTQTSLDIQAFVQAVLRESYLIQSEALKDHAQKVKAYNEAKEKIREEIKEARERRNELNKLPEHSSDSLGSQTLLEVSKSSISSRGASAKVGNATRSTSVASKESCASLEEEMKSLQQQIESFTEDFDSGEQPPPEPRREDFNSEQEYLKALAKHVEIVRIHQRNQRLKAGHLHDLQNELAAVETQLKLCFLQQKTGRASVIEPKINDQVSALERESIHTNQYVYPADDPCAGLEQMQNHLSQTIANFSLDSGISEPPPAPRREDFNSREEYLKALDWHVHLVKMHQRKLLNRVQQLEDFKNELAEVEAQLESCRNPTATTKPESVYGRELAQPAVKSQMDSRQFTAISNIMKTKQDAENASINNIRGDDSDTSQSDQSQEEGEGSPGTSVVSEPAKTLSKAADTKAIKTQKLEAIGSSPRLPEAASSDTDTTDFNTAQKWQQEQTDGALMYHALTELSETAIVESKMDKASSAQIQKQADQSSGTPEETGINSETSDEGIYIGPRVYDGRKVLDETSVQTSESKHFEVVSRTGESVHTGPRINEYSSTEDYLASLRTGITLTISNRSLFELLEVLVHDTLDYQNAPNLLQNPLPDEGQIGVPFESGQYVTVIRRRVSGGETIAFTTGRGLDVPENGYTLQVFQESFRLLPPEDN
jgi:hypothetical protein